MDLTARALDAPRPAPPACGCLTRMAAGPYAWGVRPLAAERPGTAAEAAACLADLAHAHPSTWIVGSASRLGACPPLPREAAFLHTDRLAGVVAYEPSDLTLTVRGGTPLEDVHALLAERRLELPGAHFGLAGGTVGGALATGLHDPRRGAFGPLRDRILGMQIAATDGRLTRSGGRVVKNVAGYDVGRLVAGSMGALALVTEVTLRLAPTPLEHAPFERGFEDPGEAARAALAIALEAPALGFVSTVSGRAGAMLAWVHEGDPEAVAAGIRWSEARFGPARAHDRADAGAPLGARLLLSALEHVCPERSNVLLRASVRPSRIAGLMPALLASEPLLLGVAAIPGSVLLRYDLGAPAAAERARAACAAIEAAGGTWRWHGAWREADGPRSAPWGGIETPWALYGRIVGAFDPTGSLGPAAFRVRPRAPGAAA